MSLQHEQVFTLSQSPFCNRTQNQRSNTKHRSVVAGGQAQSNRQDLSRESNRLGIQESTRRQNRLGSPQNLSKADDRSTAQGKS